MIEINPNYDKSNYYFSAPSVRMFFDEFKTTKEDIKGKSLYFLHSCVSQDKVRDAGFTICRSPEKADVIVVNNIERDIKYLDTSRCYFRGASKSEDIISLFDFVYYNQANNYKYITSDDLYKYLYKYTGDLDMYTQVNELFKSNDSSNIKMAMEFISNADWGVNKIYLMDIFASHYSSRMRSNDFRSSISFKGFVNSLDFNYKNVSFYAAIDYKENCKTLEHHEWVRDKYKHDFEEDLKHLFEKHKMKVDKLEYSIDM